MNDKPNCILNGHGFNDDGICIYCHADDGTQSKSKDTTSIDEQLAKIMDDYHAGGYGEEYEQILKLISDQIAPKIRSKPMTNYNERLDEILADHREWMRGIRADRLVGTSSGATKKAITSLIKELVAEARIDELKHLTDDDGIWYQDMARQFPQKITINQRIKELEVWTN